jgi:hypothetical protein
MRKLLIVLLLGMALSAGIGGFDLAFQNARWMKLPLQYLTGFDSIVIPGLILLFVVGGTNLVAGVAVVKRHKLATELSEIAGLGLMIWFFTELYLFRDTNIIQVVYFAWSILILVMTFLVQKRGFINGSSR